MGNKNEGRFMIAVGAIIEHISSGKILLLKRSLKVDFQGGIWEEVNGRMKQLEEPEIALKREVKEETGLKIKIVKPINIFHVFRGKKSPDNELVGIIYWCKSSSKKIRLSDEHTDYKWLSPIEALELLHHKGIKKDIESFIKEKSYQSIIHQRNKIKLK